MIKFLRIAALLALFALPSGAEAANCFWVGGTGTYSTSNTASWASASGGGAGTCAATGGVPKQAADNATFDASSGGGTVTVDSTMNGVTLITLAMGGFGGTIDFNTNNPSMTLTTSLSVSGTGTRNINLGSGTFTLSATSGNVFDATNVTGLTPTFQNASFVLSGNAATRTFVGNGQSYGPITINNNSTKGVTQFGSTGANTFASVTVGSGNTLYMVQAVTTTITGALNITGTASAPSGLSSNNAAINTATVSIGSASALDYTSILSITKAGAGAFTTTNSFDLGRNTGITINPPSGGGGGGGRIIGG